MPFSSLKATPSFRPTRTRSAPDRLTYDHLGGFSAESTVYMENCCELNAQVAAYRDCGKNWKKIAAMVPGRTKTQCCARWHNGLDPNIDEANGRTGTWTEDEDHKLEAAVQTHGGKNWKEIAAMVPGRTTIQCNTRWHYALDPGIAQTTGSTGAWTEDEYHKLEAAVQTHGGKNWKEIAAMVPGRTKTQCCARWHNVLNLSVAMTGGSTGAWTEDEDLVLKVAVQTHGGKNWKEIAAMVPSRTISQCNQRWRNALDPSIALTAGSTGAWTEDEDLKLKAAVQTHGGKNWASIAAKVGRTEVQCCKRWGDAWKRVIMANAPEVVAAALSNAKTNYSKHLHQEIPPGATCAMDLLNSYKYREYGGPLSLFHISLTAPHDLYRLRNQPDARPTLHGGRYVDKSYGHGYSNHFG
jgi:hypothetical protein